ncbi:MAG: methyltransferase domain-containing protein, partial [Opitutae bacterium]|nr:methyltransferase domain-containing protein [Opitutae bacterium]
MAPWPRRKQKLLDIGCGTGMFLEFFWSCGFDLTGMDKSPDMLARARDLGLETVWDRYEKMLPECGFGELGVCCRNCNMGPCRISPFEDQGPQRGICGATADIIVARNLIRMIAGGAAAHSDHGRGVAEVFLSAARKETDAYHIKDTRKLLEIAPALDVPIQVEVDGKMVDRDIDEIA